MIKLKLNKQVICYGLPGPIKLLVKKALTVPNPAYEENRRMGRYNRDTPKYLKLYINEKRLTVPIGYLDDLKTVLNSKKKQFEVYDNRTDFECQYEFTGVLKDYQNTACTEILKHSTGTLVAPTGAGKTVMALYLITQRKQKTIIIVHTAALAEQWAQRIRSFINVNDHEIGMIGGGKSRIGRRITIALVQSMYKRIDELSGIFGYVLVDECHRVSSRTFSVAINGLKARYKNGLSATPYRRDSLTKLIFLYVGPIRHRVDKKTLLDNGSIVQPIFVMMETGYTTSLSPVHEYSTMLSELCTDIKRNEQIIGDVITRIKSSTACVLVLSDRKEHCYTLQSMLLHKGVESTCLTGDITNESERSKIIRDISYENPVLIATGQLVGEGFDCPVLNTLFIASPIAFDGRVIQYIGRIMRPDDSGERPVVYDYVDLHVPVLMRQAKKRMKVYGKNNIKWGN